MIPLTKPQKRVYDYIASLEHPPSYDEIAQACGYKSKSSVHRIIEQIEKRGWIKRNLGFNRSIEVIREEGWQKMWEKRYWPDDKC